MCSTLQHRMPNIKIVRDNMFYSKDQNKKRKGVILGKVIDQMGSKIQYMFLPRNPGYFWEDSVFINFLIEEAEFKNGYTLCQDCLVQRLICWIRQNIPYESFEQMKEIQVWNADRKPKHYEGELMEGKAYNILVSNKDGKPQLWVWKK